MHEFKYREGVEKTDYYCYWYISDEMMRRPSWLFFKVEILAQFFGGPFLRRTIFCSDFLWSVNAYVRYLKG